MRPPPHTPSTWYGSSNRREGSKRPTRKARGQLICGAPSPVTAADMTQKAEEAPKGGRQALRTSTTRT